MGSEARRKLDRACRRLGPGFDKATRRDAGRCRRRLFLGGRLLVDGGCFGSFRGYLGGFAGGLWLRRGRGGFFICRRRGGRLGLVGSVYRLGDTDTGALGTGGAWAAVFTPLVEGRFAPSPSFFLIFVQSSLTLSLFRNLAGPPTTGALAVCDFRSLGNLRRLCEPFFWARRTTGTGVGGRVRLGEGRPGRYRLGRCCELAGRSGRCGKLSGNRRTGVLERGVGEGGAARGVAGEVGSNGFRG